MNQLHDNEVDLFELFQTLWDGKWMVSIFVAIAVLFGSSFIFYVDRSYESKLIYAFHTKPPFYKDDKVLASFEEKFYSRRVFEDWKKSSGATSLAFEDIKITKNVDGFVLTKSNNERLATLDLEMGVSFVLVKTNQLSKLDGVFKYLSHINEVLTREHVIRAKGQRDIIEARFKDLSSLDIDLVQTFLLIDGFIASADKGAHIFAVQHPTMPKMVAPKPFLILAFSAVLGGMIGMVFILVRSAMAKRKEQLAEA